MMRYLLDTNAASDCINRRSGVGGRIRQAVARGDRVGLPMPVVGELFAGIELSRARERNRARLVRALSAFVIWPFDLAAAEEHGRVFATLRRVGRPMQQIDIQIAAIALALGNATVVSADRDLAAVPGLSVENWTMD